MHRALSAGQQWEVRLSSSDSPVLKPLELYGEEEHTESGGHQAVTGAFVAGATG